jgi:hypothetical protein
MSSTSFRERFLDSLNARNGGFNKNEHITQVPISISGTCG